ncbi:E3 ubiquitin-protein ligase MARCHF5-like [Erythrolamprus reginae]|uniref:E3 ubiquitin-protein ligase MARCHF5-like n=1 Tax=Erythrolamprus reginae TaxID=121349 RepID=UPI00396C2FB8
MESRLCPGRWALSLALHTHPWISQESPLSNNPVPGGRAPACRRLEPGTPTAADAASRGGPGSRRRPGWLRRERAGLRKGDRPRRAHPAFALSSAALLGVSSPPPRVGIPSEAGRTFPREAVEMAAAVATLQEASERHCWVCFATEGDDRSAEWVCPCRCKGSTKWIHQACLQRWLDEKQKGNSIGSVNCPQCGTEYCIVFPKVGPVVYFLQQVDRILSKVSPFAAAGIVVGTLYWSAVTYGAVTVMQVVGHKKGLDVMERADPLFLLMGLPTIPVMLVLGKMIRWEDYVLRVWRKYSSKLQVLHSWVPGAVRPIPSIPLAESRYQSDHLSISRTLCGALVFPTIASLVGRITFRRVNSNLQRTILGGIAFVAIKGALKVYFRQQQYLIQANRRILNFVEKEDVEKDLAQPEEDSGSEVGLS